MKGGGMSNTDRLTLTLAATVSAAVLVAGWVFRYRHNPDWRRCLTLSSTAEEVAGGAGADLLLTPRADDPAFSPDDAPRFVKAMDRRLDQALGRVSRLRSAPLVMAEQEPAHGLGRNTGTFVHIYGYLGKVCDGLRRLQLLSDPDEARVVRNRIVADYGAVLKGLDLAEANFAPGVRAPMAQYRPMEEPGPMYPEEAPDSTAPGDEEGSDAGA
jgi:hypothetical protein